MNEVPSPSGRGHFVFVIWPTTLRGVRTLLIALALFAVAGCDSKPAAAPNSDPCNPVPAARCDKDDDCTPFLCKSSFCDKSCTSSATCATGFVCNASTGKCVKPATCGTCAGDYDCKPGQKCDLKTASCT